MTCLNLAFDGCGVRPKSRDTSSEELSGIEVMMHGENRRVK